MLAQHLVWYFASLFAAFALVQSSPVTLHDGVTETQNTNDQPVSSFYGPGAMAAWHISLFSASISGILRVFYGLPRSQSFPPQGSGSHSGRRFRRWLIRLSLDIDFIIIVVYPVLAACDIFLRSKRATAESKSAVLDPNVITAGYGDIAAFRASLLLIDRFLNVSSLVGMAPFYTFRLSGALRSLVVICAMVISAAGGAVFLWDTRIFFSFDDSTGCVPDIFYLQNRTLYMIRCLTSFAPSNADTSTRVGSSFFFVFIILLPVSGFAFILSDYNHNFTVLARMPRAVALIVHLVVLVPIWTLLVLLGSYVFLWWIWVLIGPFISLFTESHCIFSVSSSSVTEMDQLVQLVLGLVGSLWSLFNSWQMVSPKIWVRAGWWSNME